MGTTRPTAKEIVERGQAIYELQIRPRVEREHFGKYLVIDIDTGEYEIDTDHLAASNRAAAKHPDAPLFAMRIGHRAGGRLGDREQPMPIRTEGTAVDDVRRIREKLSAETGSDVNRLADRARETAEKLRDKLGLKPAKVL